VRIGAHPTSHHEAIVLRHSSRTSISVITPSFNMLPYLRRCAASIQDQGPATVNVEHIVIDGSSSDGTVEWLQGQQTIAYKSEPDAGMYDALNKGLDIAQGEIIAYLNCDEQYLPGALDAVAEAFKDNQTIDMLFGGVLVTNRDGRLLSCRPAYRPSWRYIAASHLYLLSAGMFFRRRVVEGGIRFDATLSDVADARFVVQVLRSGYRAACLRRYVAAFSFTGQNKSLSRNARLEAQMLLSTAPWYIRATRWGFVLMRRLEKLLSGGYSRRPITYRIYQGDDIEGRACFSDSRPSWRWPRSTAPAPM